MAGQYVFGGGAPLGFAGAPVGSMNTFIGGDLPWNATPSPAPTSLPGLTANYQSEYAKSLGMNQANYQNILAGYQNLISQQNTGYQNLYNTVLGQLAGAETSRNTEIQDAAKAELGKETQSLINRGLGNTTVQQAVASGVDANKQRRLTEVANQFAQMRAGYQYQIGSAQLGNLAGLSRAQLDMMERVNAGYPDAGMYGQLAGMFGQAAGIGAGADRNRGGGTSYGTYGGMGLGGPRLGYTTAPSAGVPQASYTPAVSTGGGYNWMAGAGVQSPYPESGSFYGQNTYSDYGGLAGAYTPDYGGLATAASGAADYGGLAGLAYGYDYGG